MDVLYENIDRIVNILFVEIEKVSIEFLWRRTNSISDTCMHEIRKATYDRKWILKIILFIFCLCEVIFVEKIFLLNTATVV